MKTDGLFSVHGFTIPVRSSVPFRLVIFGDPHRDSPNHARSTWQDDLETFRSYKKDAYFLGLGDYFDSTSTTERSCLGKIDDDLHETLRSDLHALQSEKVKLLAKELSFAKGRIIGLIGGNHYWRFEHGGTTDTELARLLECKYLGACAFIRLTLDNFGRYSTLDIFAHHGQGASRLPGGSINRVEQMREIAEADIYIMGHDHKRGVWPATPRLRLLSSNRSGLKVGQRQSWLVRSGSYLASYEPGVRNYNVDACRGPSSLGHVELHITMTKRHGTEQDIQIHSYT